MLPQNVVLARRVSRLISGSPSAPTCSFVCSSLLGPSSFCWCVLFLFVVECTALGYFLMSDTHRNHLGQTSTWTFGLSDYGAYQILPQSAVDWLLSTGPQMYLKACNPFSQRCGVPYYDDAPARVWCRRLPYGMPVFAIKMSKSYGRFQICTFF